MDINSIEPFINSSVFIYAVFVILSFVVFLLIAALEIKKYLSRNRYVTYHELLVSPFAPSVTVVIPVFNEDRNIIDRVRALFAQQYNNFEIVVVNDGSTDKTLQALKDFFKLEAVEPVVNQQLKTQPVKSYYRSGNRAYSKLTVIDKVHGGRTDALNAGINSSERDLCLCIETDCYLDLNSLLKLSKPFLENEKKVIAVSATVQVANSGIIKDGHLIQVNFPKSLLAGFQVIEYFKAYLVERLFWGKLKGLHVIPAGVQLFDTEILVLSGGYNVNIKKSGFELVLRMSKYMHDHQLEFKTDYIPDPLCWVKSPSKLSGLKTQRQCWSIGNRQTFLTYRKLFFNKKYKVLGLLNVPFWFVSEWITPIVKVLIAGLLIFAAIYGNSEFVLILFSTYYLFSVVFCLLAFLYQEKSYRQYSSGRDVFKIFFTAFLEPILYHPLIVFWKITAVFKKL